MQEGRSLEESNVRRSDTTFLKLGGFSEVKRTRTTTMTNLRSLPLCAFAGVLFAAASASTAAFAQQPAAQASSEVRIVKQIDESQLVTLKGNVHPDAVAKNDRGPVSASLPMAGLVLVLSRSAAQQAAFDAYVESEYDSSSPNFHQWLTPDQIGERFGPSQTDIATISSWLTSRGFAVTHTAKDRMTITFSGTAGQVESAFHTSIHNLSVNGAAHIANMTNPSIPAALAPVVLGIKQLHDFHPHPLHRVGSVVRFNQELGKWQPVGGSTAVAGPLKALAASGTSLTLTAKSRPQFTIPAADTNSGLIEEDVSPYDFATIYNVLPLWNNSITGTGQTIAIVGTSDITLSDVSSYKSAFGLPAGSAPVQVKGANGIDPGVCTSQTNACNVGDLEENTLDVEVSGGVAPGAQIVLVTSGYNNQTTPTNDPIFESSQYIEENIGTSSSAVFGSHIMNVSYGECELGQGTSGNVSYYNLWQSAKAEGIAVFVASGDSGSPACDQGEDANGNPYSAQFGLAVSGVASTPFNTAVGGTDFSWCQPKIVASGNNGVVENCPATSSNPYWNATNSGTNNSSAKGYVPETPWNDTCENPIFQKYIESIGTFLSISAGTTAEQACNWVENNWFSQYEDGNPMFAYLVDTVGGGGGASNCVVNDADTSNDPTCTSGSSTVSLGNGNSVALTNNGWQKPSWQTGVTGIPSDGVRDLPDVSFFAGDGSLDSATLVCLEAVSGATCSTSNVAGAALEIGGTSVASPEMAGVMALINQKSGAAQGFPNQQLYQLATKQTYSSCSAETVTSSSSCYFQSIDQGTNAMPCSLGTAGAEGGAIYEDGQWAVSEQFAYTGAVSPNCVALNSGDLIGTLVSSGTTPGYNATAGYNLATGLGSLNVANVVNAWVSDAGTHTATMNVTLNPTGTITAATALTITATVTGADGTPTGTVAVSGAGTNGNGTLNTSGVATITIPAGTLAPGSDSLTVTYSGDSTYASTSQNETVTVAAAVPTVAVTAPGTGNVNNALTPVIVTVSGPSGTSPTPTGTVTIAQTNTGGTYSSTAQALANGAYTFTIPAGSLTSGTDTLTATYSGDTNYTTATGKTTVVMVGTVLIAPTAVTVTPSATTINSSQGLSLAVKVTGTSGTPTGTVTLTAPSISGVQAGTLDVNGSAPLVIPAGALSAGTVNFTVTYSGDATYKSATGTASVTVTASTFALAATTPTAVAPGSSTTSSITGATSTTDYTGVVTLKTCTITQESVSSPVDPPTCTVSGTITYAAGAATGTGTATILTTGNTAMLDTRPGGKGWLGAGGTALAFLVFLGIPARRRNWRALMGMVVLLCTLGTMAACGGGSINSGGGGGSTATSAGTYTFTVTGQGNDSASTTGTTTFTVTVN